MKPPCCRATLLEVREHLLWAASHVERLSYPKVTTKEALEKLASTIEIALDPGSSDSEVLLGRMSAAIKETCPSCGGLGKVLTRE